MITTVHGVSDIGRSRDHNEDAFLSNPELGIHVVCDGLGGLAAGEVASALACSTLGRFFYMQRERLAQCRRTTNLFAREALLTLIREAVQTAHLAIQMQGESVPEQAGMSCTLVMLVVLDDHLAIAHAGDSRAYLWRKGNLIPLTHDHTIGNEAVGSGQAYLQDMMGTRRAALITRCLGSGLKTVAPDVLIFEPMNEDRILICSDGVTTHLGPDDLREMLGRGPLEHVPESLVRRCNKLGGKDNITAVMAEIGDLSAAHDTELAQRMSAFHKMPLFCRLGAIEMTRVLNRCALRTYQAGEHIIEDGADDHRLFVCLSGAAEVRKDGQPLATIVPGEAVGEMSLLENAPRSADVVAKTDTAMVVFERDEFIRLMNAEPWTAIKMLFPLAQHLNARLRRANAELARGAASSPLVAETMAGSDDGMNDELGSDTFAEFCAELSEAPRRRSGGR